MGSMITRLIFTLPVLLLCAACARAPIPPTAAAPVFPTVTPGAALRAPIPPIGGSDSPVAVALVRPPSPVPDLSLCPAPDPALAMPEALPPPDLLDSTIITFLNAGGALPTLERALRGWGVITAESGAVRADLDLTGEGVPEVILSYRSGDEGALLILGCVGGRVIDRYRAALTETPPIILSADDATVNGARDLFFIARTCRTADGACGYRAQMATWDAGRARFVNLISDPLFSQDIPALEDADGDRIAEIVVRFTATGDARTGPLRTGTTFWDWDGMSYRRALTRLDPPRYRIHVLHEADAAFEARLYEDAITLYLRAADVPSLESWMPDDPDTLRAYALYRLLMTYAVSSDPRAAGVITRLREAYPDPTFAPSYVALADAFWEAFQATRTPQAACAAARAAAETRLDAVGLLNRYGSESPVYTVFALCPV